MIFARLGNGGARPLTHRRPPARAAASPARAAASPPALLPRAGPRCCLEVVVATLLPRAIDTRANAHRVLRALPTHRARQALIARVGWLNLLSPEQVCNVMQCTMV